MRRKNGTPFDIAHSTLWLSRFILTFLLTLVSCGRPTKPPTVPPLPSPAKGLAVDELAIAAEENRFLAQPSFDPRDAEYFDLVNNVLALTPEELALLEKNGFVVSDRLAFRNFTRAYAYVFWRDLPVVVTTDSIMQALHQAYDDLLIRLEMTVLTSRLIDFLSHAREQLAQAASADTDPVLRDLDADLEIYLTVPLALLTGQDASSYDTPAIETYLRLAQDASEVAQVDLFGGARKVDFTLFKPRGHYTQFEGLERYFRAMSWLAHIDFRLLEYDLGGGPQVNLQHIAAAAQLSNVISKSEQRSAWEQIDALLSAFIGRSDNMTLSELDAFLADAGIDAPQEAIHFPEPGRLATLLTNSAYQQLITGQLLSGAAYAADPVSRPVSFMLLGQRFTIDSYLMSNLVYDRLLVDGQKVQRPLPDPLDVMHVLGNRRAVAHLQDELAQYGYWASLVTLRTAVDGYDPAFWTSNLYNRRLGMLRTLNVDTTSEDYPQAMRTAAWSDKVLHTQLAAWAQLRHENILYAKQSVTVMPICEYPDGYVEPYPEFYAAVQEYARAGLAAFTRLRPGELTEDELALYQKALAYFGHVDKTADQLKTMASKELRLEPFSEEEKLFLKSIAVRHVEEVDFGCVTMPQEKWEGWYVDLFPWGDDTPLCIADVHTNPNNDPAFPSLLPPSVLHVGTGPVATMVFIADTDEGPTMYVGPVFTYYQLVKEGFPPVRLTDQDWEELQSSGSRPMPPGWTQTFRLAISGKPAYLELSGSPDAE